MVRKVAGLGTLAAIVVAIACAGKTTEDTSDGGPHVEPTRGRETEVADLREQVAHCQR